MKAASVGRAVDVYRKLAGYPCITSGNLVGCQPAGGPLTGTSIAFPGGGSLLNVYSEWTHRDLGTLEKTTFSLNHVLSRVSEEGGLKYENVTCSGPQVVSNQMWRQASLAGDKIATIRSIGDSKNKSKEDKQLVEVWSECGAGLKSFDVLSQAKHGKVYGPDGTFGSFQWSPSGTKIMYMAEKEKTKTESFFTRPKTGDSNANCEDVRKGDQFVYDDHWGEQLETRVQPVICVLDTDTGTVSVLEIPDGVSPGQAVWGPDDSSIVFVGCDNEPWKLGLIYCPIRKNALYLMNLDSNTCDVISPEGRSVGSPRVSPDRSRLVYLANNIGGPHMQCRQLYMLDFKTKETSLLVDIVNSPEKDAFPGLFALDLPARCWTSDRESVVLSSVWRSVTEAVIVNTATKEVRRLSSNPDLTSFNVLDVFRDVALACASSPDRPHRLVVGQVFPPAGQEVAWQYVSPEANDKVDLSWKIIQHSRSLDEKFHGEYESILLEPRRAEGAAPSPLVVWCHGGPHSVFTTDFLLYPACLCHLGYVVLLVNYNGSFGFGQDSIYSLAGHVGTNDVKDVQFAVEQVLRDNPDSIDGNKAYVIGGSHGGFLTAHLIGQYPLFYNAAVMRNPVVNIASMLGLTDIPDWCAVGSGLQFDSQNVTSPELFKKAYDKSPIQYIDKVEAPVLIMLGANDLRVPPSQGKEYWRALKARNKATRLLVYPDNSHPINKVEAESDAFVNIANWFSEHV